MISLNLLIGLLVVSLVLAGCIQTPQNPQNTQPEDGMQSFPTPTVQPAIQNASELQSDEMNVFGRALEAAINSQK